jgi:hypothetical protein
MIIHEPVPVLSLTDPVQAELLRSVLEQHGISCEIEGGRQAGFAGVLEIRLFVPADDAERAREILEATGE